MDDRADLLALLRSRSVRFGDFTLASGARSDFYVDCRLTTTHAEGQRLIGRVGLAALAAAGLRPDAVGGLTMGADPVAYAITHASALVPGGAQIHAFSVRKTPKTHGRTRRIEGCFEPGARVVVVEDVVTSGASALQACDAVRAEGGTVLGVLTLVEREGPGRAAIEAAGYRLDTIFGIAAVLGRA